MTSGIYKFLLILQKINNRKNFNKISVNYYNYYYKSSKLLDFNKLIFLKIDYYSYIKYKNFYFLIFWIFRINNTSGAYINNFTTSYFNLNLIYKRLFINLIKFTNHTNTLVFKKSTFVHYVYKFYLKNLIRKFFYTYKYFHNFYLNNNINVKNFFFTKFFIVFNVNKKYFLNYYKYFLISKLHSNNIINKYKFYQKINIIKNLIKTKSKIKKKFFKQIRKFNRKTKINLLQNFSVKRFKQLIRKKLPILSLRKKQNLFFYKRKKKFVLKKVALRSPGDDVAFFKKNFKKDELFKKYVVFKKHILFNKGFFFLTSLLNFIKNYSYIFYFFIIKLNL